jgi:tetratricopeptide (TPR) repeat protein
LVLILQIYSPALHGPFLLDDGFQMFGRPGAETLPLRTWIQSLRPLLNFTFWINFQLSGTGTYSYHVVNVLLHWANSWLLFLILTRLWHFAGGAGILPPIYGAALFLLHPLQAESVAYITSRSETLSIFFAYSALAIFITRNRALPTTFPRAAAVLLLLSAAVLTKEHTAAMPAVFILVDYFWTTPFEFAGLKRNWRLYLPLAAGGVLGASFIARTFRTADTAGFRMKDLPWDHFFFSQWRMFWRYLRMTALPTGLNVDPDIPLSRSVTAEFSWLAGLAIVALLIIAWQCRRSAPLAAFGIFTFAILLAPTSSIVPIRDLFAERRVYLPFVGISCVALEIFRRWKIPEWAPLLVLAVFAFLTYQRSHAWSSALALWQDSVAGSPNKQRPRFQLAFVHYSEGRCTEATSEFAKAAELAPPDDALYIDWALSLECAGKPDEAIEKLKLAARQKDTAHIRSVMAMVFAKSNRSDDALRELAAAERLNPGFSMTYVYRGHIYAQRGQNDAAAAEYRRALAQDPANAAASVGLRMLGVSGH